MRAYRVARVPPALDSLLGMTGTGGALSSGLTIWIGLFTLLAVAFGRVPGVSLSRAVLALAGATLLVVTGAVSLERALSHVNGEVLVLLFGLMAVNVVLAEAGAFRLLTALVTRGTLGPRRLLALLVFSSGALSALFLNDTVALMLTPLVIRVARRLSLPPVPYLLALALAVNAGSVATVTGNPQNVLVAVTADIRYGVFAAHLTPVAVLSLVVVWVVIVLAYGRGLGARKPAPPAVEQAAALALPPVRTGRLAVGGGAALAMLIAFAVGVPVALAAVTAGTVLLLARGRASGALLRRIDYGLLVLFAGLFVVVGAMADTGLPQRWLLDWLPVEGSGIETIGITSLVTAGLSTLVSNVPAVLVLLPATGFDAGGAAASTMATAVGAASGDWLGSRPLALTIAMASTLAGNLTLVASVANLIVAEGAKRLGVELSFWAYLRVGLPVTVVTLLVGTLWLATFTGG